MSLTLSVESRIETKADVTLHFRDGTTYTLTYEFNLGDTVAYIATRPYHVVGRRSEEVEKVVVKYNYEGSPRDFTEPPQFSQYDSNNIFVKIDQRDWATRKLRELALNAEET
jgi:hypothetical protein